MRTRTPQYKNPIVDIRIAKAKKLAMRFLDELDIDHDSWDAVTKAKDVITYYDPAGPHPDHPTMTKVMAEHKKLVDLIVILKTEGLV